MNKMVHLLTFTKWEDENVTNPNSIIDIQYHCFDDCTSIIDVIREPIYKAFLAKGYNWSCVLFPLDLAYKCGFTISKKGE